MTSQTTGKRSIHLSYATLQVQVFARLPFGNQLFWFRETFNNQVASCKILAAMATKMVETWRVDYGELMVSEARY